MTLDWLQIKRFLAGLPLVETIMFIILLLITIYRKRLSSNHGYRYKPRVESESRKDQLKRRRYHTNKANRSSNAENDNFQITNIIQDFKTEVLSNLITDPSDIFLEEKNMLQQDNTTSALTSQNGNSALISSSQQQSSSFLNFSNELILQIVVHCETMDIIKLSLVSKQFRKEIVENEFLWEQLWKITYSHIWQDPAIVEIRMWREIHWDPLKQFPAPQYGWFKFYLTFELCWIDWLLAGLCTREKCYIAINDAIFHLTDFIPDHPGSAETLLDHSGGDATEVFMDIGHSDYALALMESFCIFDSHEVYLHKMHQRVRIFAEGYYNQIKIRQIPALTGLHDAMRTLQKSLVGLHEKSLLQSAMILRGKFASATLEDSFPLAPKLKAYLSCDGDDHHGQCRSYFDPLSREWVIWHTCCGRGRVLQDVPQGIMEDCILRTIFEDHES